MPARLIIIGGGYIGLEMAQFYRRLGSAVLVLESGGRIAGHEDPDVASGLQKLLEREGVEFRLNSGVEKVEGRAGHIKLTVGSSTVDATHVFVATGRKPNTDDLGLETIGVKMSDRGTEEEARKAGFRMKIGRYEMARNAKAMEAGETAGFIKVVVDVQAISCSARRSWPTTAPSWCIST